MTNNNENVVEWLTGENTATITLTNRKYITKIQKLHNNRVNDFVRYIENDDGSICATVPLSWIKINPPKQVSESQREAARERFNKMWNRGD